MSEDLKTAQVSFKNCVLNEFENLSELLKEFKLKERLELLVKLLPYALPKKISLLSPMEK